MKNPKLHSADNFLEVRTQYFIVSELVKNKMEIVLDEGVQFILTLQKSWDGWEKEILFLSKVGDPRNSFLIYFPLAYHFNHNLGVSVLWTTIISEWLNLILKW